MRFLPALICLTMLMIGCQANPRYRTGSADESGAETKNPGRRYNPEDKTSKFEKVNSRDLIELGRIIQSYLGRPYSGISRYEEGLDCSRFTQLVFREFNNTELPRTASDQYKTGRRVSREHLRYGDLVFFRTDGSGISHVGIYAGYDEFVHASSSAGVIITGMHEKYWRKRYAGARRILP
ncbi:MAG: C40 family peptidase [Candidatus Zixiibacteriota bacterium]|nr:MAG: C40 family peptidase [candidate division Zixibacteria bacterium]